MGAKPGGCKEMSWLDTCGKAFQAEGIAGAKPWLWRGPYFVKLQGGFQMPMDVQLSNQKEKTFIFCKFILGKIRSVEAPSFLQ